MAAQHTVIGSAHDLGEQEHLKFEAHSHNLSAQAKRTEAPVRADQPPSKTVHRTTQQPRVLLFLRKPQIHQSAHRLALAAKGLRVMRDKTCGTATIAQLELFQG